MSTWCFGLHRSACKAWLMGPQPVINNKQNCPGLHMQDQPAAKHKLKQAGACSVFLTRLKLSSCASLYRIAWPTSSLQTPLPTPSTCQRSRFGPPDAVLGCCLCSLRCKVARWCVTALPWFGLPFAAPPSPLLRVLRPTPFGADGVFTIFHIVKKQA